MKKSLISISLLICGLLSLHSQDLAINGNVSSPKYKWVTDTIMSLGKIELNKPANVTFEFVNSGNEPLIITKVEPSCGCTSVDYSKSPVNKGEKGFIKASYNASSLGFFQKNLTVFANTNEYRKILSIKGEVIK